MRLVARHKSIAVCLIGAWALWAPRAEAAFIGPYQLTDWSLVNTNGNGSATTLDGGNSIILSGPNNGSGLSGSTELLITVIADSILSFEWSYFSLDAPGSDWAGYLVAAQFSLLTGTSGDTGTAGITVKAGQEFGFSVRSSDNTGEPGILTISDFNQSQTTDVVPEPGTGTSILWVGAAFLLLIRRSPRKVVPGGDWFRTWSQPEFLAPAFLGTEQAAPNRKCGRQTQ